jgi:putative MFS transporter
MAAESGQSATMTVDELLARLDQSPLTTNHYKLITTAMLGDMLEFFDYWIIGFVLAFIVIPWKLSFGATAVVLLSAGVGSLIGAFSFGHLADRIGRIPVLMITTITFSIPSGIMYLTPEGNWIFLAGFRFLVGLGVGGLYAVDLPLVQEFVPSRYRAVTGGIVTALIPAGSLLGGVCAAYLTPAIGWRGLFLIGLIPATLSLAFRFWMRESPRWLIKQGRYRDAVDSINWVTGEKIDYRNVVASADDRAAEKKASFVEIFQCRRSVAVTWTTGFMQALMDYGFTLWGPTLLALVLKVPAQEAAKMFIFVSISSIVAKFSWSFLAERFGRRPCGMAIGVGAFVTCIIIALYWNAWWGGVPVIFLAFLAVFVFIGGGWAVTGPYAPEVWPQRLRATGMGSAYGIAGLGRIVGPFVLSLFAGAGNVVSPKATTGAIAPTYVFYAVCGLVLSATYYFGIETRNRSIAEIEALVTSGAREAAAKGAGNRG